MSNIFKRERSKDRAQTLKSRRLRMERLESRELLSVTSIELAEIPGLYSSTAFSESASGVGAIDWSAFQSEANALGAGLDDADSGRTYVVTTALDVVDPDDGVTSLREAAGLATSLDTIAFAPSLQGQTIRLSGSEITISTGVAIDASALYDEATGTPGITIDAFGRSRAFSIDGGTADDPATLIGLTITGGYVSNDCGGAIYVAKNGTLSVKNSTFTANSARYSGGAIYVAANGTLSVENSTFVSNGAAGSGGAIGAENGTLSVKNSTFTSNNAGSAGEGGDGGAIYCNSYHYDVPAILNVENSTFESNGAGYVGGAICYESCYNDVLGMLNVENSTFTANSAECGGAIYSNWGTATLSGVTATGNTSRIGGAIYSNEGKMTASNFRIEQNESVHSSYYGSECYSCGGGIYNRGTLTLTNGAIVDNVAKADYFSYGSCSTYAYGGGIYNEGTLTATNVTIARNEAQCSNYFDANEAGNYGGGLYNAYCESSATLRNVIIAENYVGTVYDAAVFPVYDAAGSDVYLESGTLDASRTLSSYEFENADENYLYDPNAPLFVDVVFQDYRLAPFSQAINKGDDQYAYDAGLTGDSRDLAGRPRFVGDSVDLGAYERTPIKFPTNVKLSDYDASTKTATLTWTDNATNEVRYEVQSSTNGGAWRSLPDLPANATSRVCYKLIPGNVYVYRIRAVAADGTASAWVSSTISPPATPTNATFGDYDASTNTATLTWTDNATNEVRYEIQSSTNGGEWTALADLPANAASLVCSGLSRGTVSAYRVRAVSAEGVASAWASAKIEPSSTPTNVKLSDYNLSTKTATLTWTDNATNEVRYEVQSSTNGGAWRSLPDLPANATSRVCYKLIPGNVYVYRIRAVLAGGVASAWVSATIAPSTTPTNVKIVDYDASTKRATLIWTRNSVSDRVWYEIQSSTNGGEWRTLAYPSAGMTSRICYNLKPGNVYVYRIRAVENGGTTSAWASATLDLAISESSESGSNGEASVSSATLASEAFANPFDDFDFFEEEWKFGF